MLRSPPGYGVGVRLRVTLAWAVLAASLPTPAATDPLDKVNGMEGWNKAGPENLELEWHDWYRARVEWRRASRDLRVQRVISARLAPLLDRADPPTQDDLRRIIRSGTGPVAIPPAAPDADGARPAPQPSHTKSPRPRPRPPAPAPAPPPPADPGDGTADRTPEPPGWSKVPVEKLDKDGQALDEEGDRELNRAGKRRRR